MQTRHATYLTDHHRAGRSGGGSKSAPAPEAGIGGGGIVLADGGRRDGDADDQCSANEGERAENHGSVYPERERREDLLGYPDDLMMSVLLHAAHLWRAPQIWAQRKF